jgi:WD40 repeat protein
MGSMKASPNGNKLAIVTAQQCNNISELFDFDKSTGMFSNLIKLRTDSVAIGLYGVSFSPDNSKLYITSWINNNKIYQYDLSSGNPTTIISSKNIIASQSGGPWYMAMQLGPDGKLYIAERSQSTMGVIHFPNLLGVNSTYENTSVSLNGKINTLGLPNFIDFFDYSNTIFNCQTGIEEENYFGKTLISPNPFSTLTTLQTGKSFKGATLTVHNSFGQTVKQINNLTGQTIVFHRENLASGLYFIRLTEDNKTFATDKLIITDN